MTSTTSPSGQTVHANIGSGRLNAHSGLGSQYINEGSGNYFHGSPKISLNFCSCVCYISNPGAADDGRDGYNKPLSRITSPALAIRRHQSADRNITPVRSTSSHNRPSPTSASGQRGSDTHTRKSIFTFLKTWLPNPYKRDAQGRTALHDASRSGSLLVEHSLNNHALPLWPGLSANINLADLIDTPDNQGRTPVHHVTIRNDFCSLYHLAEKGANLELVDKDGRTILHIAAKQGQLSMVDYLLEKGVWLEGRDKRGLTPLHLAAMKGRTEVVSSLVVRSILRVAAQRGIRSLRRMKDDFYSWTPLHCAVRTRRLETVKALVKEFDDEGRVERPRREDARDDIDIRDYRGQTALHLACALPAQIQIQTQEQGDSHHDIHQVASGIVSTLVDAGAKMDVQDFMGCTPLMYAAQRANLGAVRCLVNKGANVDMVDGRNRTARDYAKHDAPRGEDRDEVLRILSPSGPMDAFLRLQ